MTQTTRIDRARGCLLGLAVGDALGAPLEGLTYQQIQAHYQTVTDYVDGARAWKRKPYRWRMPGLYSDDTQQALAIADVLLERGRLDEVRLAGLYVELATPEGDYAGAHRGIGRSFRQVLELLKSGVSPWKTGQASAGIGAAMRIAPAAIYHLSDPEGLYESVVGSGFMTHRDVRSLAGAFAVAHAVRRLASGAELGPSLPLRLASDVAASEKRLAAEYGDLLLSLEHRHAISQAIAHVESILDLRRDRAIAALIEEANRRGPGSQVRRATQGFPPACIPTCLYFLLTTDSFEEALIEIVNLGGDADSAGAILGALSGAAHGVGGIPERWLMGLANRDGIDARAQALSLRSADGIEIPDLVSREHALTAEEAACRESMRPGNPPGDVGVHRR